MIVNDYLRLVIDTPFTKCSRKGIRRRQGMSASRIRDGTGQVFVEIRVLCARNMALAVFFSSFRRLHQVESAIQYPPGRPAQLRS